MSELTKRLKDHFDESTKIYIENTNDAELLLQEDLAEAIAEIEDLESKLAECQKKCDYLDIPLFLRNPEQLSADIKAEFDRLNAKLAQSQWVRDPRLIGIILDMPEDSIQRLQANVATSGDCMIAAATIIAAKQLVNLPPSPDSITENK